MKRISFEGSYIYVPNNVTRKFEAIFGQNWAVPDPDWKKPVFPGRELIKEFSFNRGHLKRIIEHSRYEDGKFLHSILVKWTDKLKKAGKAKTKAKPVAAKPAPKSA